MKVLVDVDRCEGFASCVLSAPDVFDLDERSGVAVLLVEEPPDALLADVQDAVRSCPVRAISLA